jgi:hypothetical protein
MKKYLALLLVAMSFATVSHAALILSDSFTYVDGPLTNVSGGTWSIHSGTTPINVVSEEAVISQANSQDNNAQLTGAPYNSGNLYASFVVNFSTLPTAGGTYFLHFKDATTGGFRCRVFAGVTGAGANMFRVGIARASGTAIFIPTDLSLNTDYLLVIRYDAGNGNSTLWINPGSEGATADRADGTDTWTATPITSFGLRQAGSLGILTLDDLKVGTAFADVVDGGDPSLNPPFISNIPDQSLPRGGATPAVPFYVTDGETAHGALTLSAASANTTLVPVNAINFVNTMGDSNRTVMVTPAAGEQGVSEITVTVTDGDMNTSTRKFLVIVGAPTVSTIANQITPMDTTLANIPFTVGDLEGDTLTLSAGSTNETVVPVGNITFGGSGANRTVSITPAAGVMGLTRITIFVSDGFNTVSNRFVLNVYGSRGVDLCDSFTYADGSVVPNSSFFWGYGSGTNGDAQVLGGQLLLSGSRSEDIGAFLTNSPYLPSQGWILYSKFTANFSSRPTAGNGEYFAHFRGTLAGGSFGARIFATTNGAAAGKLRLGISASAGAPPSAVLPTDLETNVTYTVVTRYNVGTGLSTLWVNPVSEASTSVTSTDNAFTFDVYTYAFRQNSGIGNLAVDDVKVGTAFSDVVESRPALTITATGNNVTLSWPTTPGYVLRFTDSFPAGWADFGDQGTPAGPLTVVTLNGVTDNRFFELRKP